MRPSKLLSTATLLAAIASLAPACAVAPADAPSTATSNVLPLRTLRLYETGVGYFERSGTLSTSTATSLPVPPGQLDDALASLVVLRSGVGGVVTGLSFASSVTKATARSRAALPTNPDTPILFRDLLESMKGEKVTVVTDPAQDPIAGRVVLVGMEVDAAQARAVALQKDAPAQGTDPPQRLVVTLLTDGGALTRIPAESILRIRPSDPAFAGRLDEALDSLGTRSTRNARALKLLGDVRGQVTFGYVTETPIWRASYRLVEESATTGAAAGESPRTAVLQGWALLHNDTDEEWRDVHLELVNGEPDSFLFPLAAPRYARRPLVHPTNALSTLPQLQDNTADRMWGDNLDETETVGSGQGFGSGHGHLGGSHETRSPSIRQGGISVDGSMASSGLLDVGNLADLAPAAGVEQGALFTYALPNAFSLEAHASALVPFIQRGVSAETVIYFAGPGQAGRAAIHFVNSTGQTLPTGTITVFGAGGFTGETSLDRLKPGERRFLQIGNDLDGEVKQTKTESHEEAKRLALQGDTLQEHLLRTTTDTWEVENRGGTTRSFYVVVNADKNAKVTGADRVDFDEAIGKPVVILSVKSKTKAPRVLTLVEGMSRAYSIDNLTEKSVKALLQKTTIAAAELAILQAALPAVRALEAAHATVARENEEAKVTEHVLERVREDLKSLGGTAAAPGGGAIAAPLVKRLVDAEDKVEAGRKAKEAAQKVMADRREAVREALAPLAHPAPGG